MSKPFPMALALCAVTVSFTFTRGANAQPKPSPVKIGTFDSRAVALAYWRSDQGMKQVDRVHQEYAKAEAASDEKRMKELAHQGPGLQVRIHQQTFSTGCVTDIIKKVEKAIGPIARQAGVSVIVSKWQIAHQDPSVEHVDVTPQLVELFDPNDEVRKMIDNLRKKEPVPIDQLSMDPKR